VRPAPERMSIGSMVEVPALLWQLDDLLPHVDFLSIGSNDLMQFLFAADRGAPDLAGRYDLLSPAVIDILKGLSRRTAEAGVAISLCGEAASRPLDALVLAALGITTLSMPASSVLPVKELLTAVDLARFRQVLAAIRKGAGGVASLREPVDAWARENNLPI
jgi:phosphotransferase system, enzyme I, PtsP